jgi:hypothetical protein
MWKPKVMSHSKELEKPKQDIMKWSQIAMHEEDDPSFSNEFINFILTV